jgi:hypothetical protein
MVEFNEIRLPIQLYKAKPGKDFPCHSRCDIRDFSPISDLNCLPLIGISTLKEVDHDTASFRISPAQEPS